MSDSRGMTRRRFVAGAAGGAAMLAAGVPLSGCGKSDARRRGSVVVVGAGLAGLTAAYELDRKGWEVTVVEARDRVGGRCHTFRSELDFGQVAEAGGEFIDASHSAVRGYAKRFGLELDDLRKVEAEQNLSDAVYVDKRLHDYDTVVDQDVQAELDRFDERLAGYAAAIDANDPARTGAGLDTRSVADLLDQVDLAPDARVLAEADLRAEYAVEPEQLSLLFAVALEAIGKDLAEADVERYRIRGGNDQLPRALAGAVHHTLVLRSPVDAIHERGSRVRVVAGGLRVEADYCVVTAPLPALRAVDLHLNLPRRVREAIARVQYGDVVKTALQYRRRFWADEGWSGTTVADLPIQASWDATGSQPGAGGVLMTYSAGREAERVGAAPVRARIDSAERQLAQVYPGSDGLAVAGASVAWGRERYSGGAYSAWGPGQYTRYWAALRRPYGRVHFAGEHTDVYASYMEGAVRSGQRVATAIEARRG